MGVSNICEQCKAHAIPARSLSRTPCGSSAQSSASRTACAAPSATKAVYVHTDPCEKTCIVFNKDDGECGGKNSICVKFPSASASSSKVKVKCGPGGSGGTSSGGCIEIMGNSIIKTKDGGLQIVPCNKGTMQISLGGGACGPVLQVGNASARSCGSKSSVGGLKVCPCEGGLKLNFGNRNCGSPSIICSGSQGSNVQILVGPQKRRLDMNHCKPTIAFMIHKRLVELESELRMAECAYSDLHP